MMNVNYYNGRKASFRRVDCNLESIKSGHIVTILMSVKHNNDYGFFFTKLIKSKGTSVDIHIRIVCTSIVLATTSR